MVSGNKKIVFTGGGSVGHVAPNLVLIEKFQAAGWQISYLGSYKGMERELVTQLGIPYYGITTGKLRRYFSWRNFLDPFKIIYGIAQALILCWQLRPAVIFSKGGFVSFPVVVAAYLRRIPVVLHESDLTLGLANRLALPLATKLCTAFPETRVPVKYRGRVVSTGIPVRSHFFSGDAAKGRALCGFTPDKPIVLVFGGSSGAETINRVVRALVRQLLVHFQVAHICGAGKIDSKCNYKGYKQFPYLQAEFPHLVAAAAIVVARAGANTIYELLTLRKPHILLPLATTASRGDQIANANYCAAHGFSEVILPPQLRGALLYDKILLVSREQESFKAAMQKFSLTDSSTLIYQTITGIVPFSA